MDETEVPIRPARADERAAVETLLREAGLPVQGLEEQFGENYCVAELDGAPVGAAGVEVHGRFGLLRSVVVAPQLRGRGLGERLVGDRRRWAEERGLEAVFLLTTTADQFFERLGWAEAERGSAPPPIRASREFAAVCPASAVLMVLPLRRRGFRG